jgi:hypothetical protein
MPKFKPGKQLDNQGDSPFGKCAIMRHSERRSVEGAKNEKNGK